MKVRGKVEFKVFKFKFFISLDIIKNFRLQVIVVIVERIGIIVLILIVVLNLEKFVFDIQLQ